MTDLELQKMLAEELPELIFYVPNSGNFHWHTENKPLNERWPKVTDHEWLWIVAECEKKLNLDNKCTYLKILGSNERFSKPYEDFLVFATWKQRAIAYFKTIGRYERMKNLKL